MMVDVKLKLENTLPCSELGMRTLSLVLALAALASCSARLGVPSPPRFPQDFHVTGSISLPYAGLEEPFNVWTYGSLGRQRIEYYGGLDLYITAKSDLSYTVVPTGADSTSCFSSQADTTITTILPSTSNYSYIGTATVAGQMAVQFQRNISHYDRVNTYTLSVAASDGTTPLRFEMLGYDILLGSHFDQYILTYDTFKSGSSAVSNSSLYQPPSSVQCQSWAQAPDSKMGNPVTGGMDNPLSVFASAMVGDSGASCDTHGSLPASEVRCKYEQFAKDHGRSDSSRQPLFEAAARFVEARNRASRAAGSDFRVALNHFADWTTPELRMAQGGMRRRDLPAQSPLRRSVSLAAAKIQPLVHPVPSPLEVAGLPAALNWTAQGAVLPPPDQAICGSCWAHGAAGTMAGSIWRKTGVLAPMSRQQLMDCSWPQGNMACDGGNDYDGYQYIIGLQKTSSGSRGWSTQASYGPYLGADGRCHDSTGSLNVPAQISSYTMVPQGNVDALKQALVSVGPISISIDASLPDFTYYSSGVYSNPNCGSSPDDLDHTVLLTGYDTTGEVPFWTVRNSWSTHWGNNGYVKFQIAGNICGVATTPTYVTLE
jgi:hypothetical protein